jgi:DNA primase
MPITDIEELREITRAAAEIFTADPRKRCALTYLRQRGIDATGLSPQWVIGYAPPGWTRLTDSLRGRFSDQALLDAGVARVSSRGTLIDTFRRRVVFGIRDTEGTICGFTGRDLSDDPRAPKYLNTHQSTLFRKSELLFGVYEGTRKVVDLQPVVVEGPMDVLAIAARHQDAGKIGLLPVAACGTAFTPAHARAVANTTYHQKTLVVVAMDGDTAGGAAALTVGEQLRSQGLDVRVATLPNDTDPAEYLASSSPSLDAFHADHCRPLIVTHVENAIAQQGDRMQWVEGRIAALRTVTGYLATYPPDHTVGQIRWLAGTLNLDPSTVTLELVEAHSKHALLESQPARAASEPAALGI